MKSMHITVLKELGLKGAVNEFIPISSGELASKLTISQQSASKKILELIDEELIERQLGARKQLIKITEKGLNVIRKEYSDYHRVFELADHITVRGTIASGMGDGQYYVNRDGYKKQFKSKLWFVPYEGTLNVKVTGSELSKFQILKDHDGIPIDSFEDGGRTFGKGKCFLCTLHDQDCAIMIPNRSHYDDVIEVLAKDYLRTKLGLKDGDVVELRISL
jgi:riboflavin kinase